MSDDPDRSVPGVSRRSILAALSAAGAAGAFTGSSTAAYLSDRDTFGGSMAAGSLDLDLCWTPGGAAEPCEPTGANTISIDIANLSTGDTGFGTISCGLATDSNPAWVWVRTPCPVDACGLERALTVTMWHGHECEGEFDRESVVIGSDGVPIEDVTLCEALVSLADGIRLDGDDRVPGVSPLAPETPCCFGIEWTLTDTVCGSDTAQLEFEFYAEQSRHNPDPDPPWPPRECVVDCETACPEECVPASFVAFCRDDAPIEMTAITSLSWTENTVTWTSSVDLDSVVLFYGPPTFETFTPESGFPAGPAHTITRGDGTPLGAGDAHATLGQTQSDPCPDGDSEGCGVRYNFPESATDEGSWDCVCGPPGPGRECNGGSDA